MSYTDQQRRALGQGDRFALKIANRSDGADGATKWLTVNANQVDRIMAIVAESDSDASNGSEPIPTDFPVKLLGPDDPAGDRATCGTCGRSWDDSISTGMTPVPAGRCPFEYYH